MVLILLQCQCCLENSSAPLSTWTGINVSISSQSVGLLTVSLNSCHTISIKGRNTYLEFFEIKKKVRLLAFGRSMLKSPISYVFQGARVKRNVVLVQLACCKVT